MATPGPLRFLARSWPFLYAVAATAFVFAIQPGYQLGVGPAFPFASRFDIDGSNPFATRLLYDDADIAAFVLRGVNANMGRTPGPVEPPISAEVIGAFDENLRLNRHPPLLDRYFLEYPHAALFYFRTVMAAVPPDRPWPATVLDFHYANIIFHHPTPEEVPIWTTFRRAGRVFVIVNVLALLVMMAALRRGLVPGSAPPPIWVLVLPSTLYFVMSRFDVLPSLFVVLGLAAAGRKRVGLSGVCLGVATALKLYPLVIAPLVWRHLTTDARTGVKWAVGFLVPLGVIFGAGIAVDGVDGVLAPFRFQLGRPPEPDWTFYGRFLPESLSRMSTARLGILGVVVGVLFALPRGDGDSVLRRAVLALLTFVSLQVFFSPQWTLWFVPLLVVLARRSGALLGLLVALDVVMYLSFPLVYDQTSDAVVGLARSPLVCVRFGLFVLIAGWLVRDEARSAKRGVRSAE